ncbi:MAG TPA: hypothetical protein VIY48_01475 [Candidatus Paceibacterota bacterium]
MVIKSPLTTLVGALVCEWDENDPELVLLADEIMEAARMHQSKAASLLLKEAREAYKASIPFCWRCAWWHLSTHNCVDGK